jgi:glutamyl-tRNA(Gln) amidotransferase subunit E
VKIREELKRIAVREDDVKEELVDVKNVFRQTKCKVIRKALDQDLQVLALRLPKFKGFLKRELLSDFRLGTEMADRARFWGRVGGIFHTDEMPAYGITVEEVQELRKTVKAEEQDAVVFVADNLENASDALRAVAERAKEAIRGVPEETRAANSDGTSRYLRPRPGAARMYPETDIPPIEITESYVKELMLRLPELPEQKLERLTKQLRLNEKVARQVLNSEWSQLFDVIVQESDISPTVVGVFFTETLKALKRDGVQVENISDERFREIFKSVGSGKLMKEAVPDVTIWLSKNREKTVQEAIDGLGLKTVSEDDLTSLVDKVIVENKAIVRERGEGSFDALMGIIMKSSRGKIDAARVSKILKERLKQKS